MTPPLLIAAAFMAGFWLGGAFLSLAIVLTQGEKGGSIASAVLFSLLWPITLMSQL